MPKIIDHDERRSELLAAVWRVIERDGIEASTIRAIAREAGFSAGTLSHYFADKEDILSSALRLSHERIVARWDGKLAGRKGIDGIREFVLDNLPLDDERTLETKLEISYWARALSRDAVLQIQQTEAADLHARLLGLIVNAQNSGEIDDTMAAEAIAERLLALIDGVSLHAVLYGERVTKSVQIQLIEDELTRIETKRTPDGAGTARTHVGAIADPTNP
jgi:AcrR family transcriptional regulator